MMTLGPTGRTRRDVLRVGAGVGVGIGGAACGAPGGGGQGASSAPAKLPATVVWASNTGQADLPYFERFAKWFEEAHPETKVDLVLPPGEGSYEAKMITMFAGGTYPDLFHLQAQVLGRVRHGPLVREQMHLAPVGRDGKPDQLHRGQVLRRGNLAQAQRGAIELPGRLLAARGHRDAGVL